MMGMAKTNGKGRREPRCGAARGGQDGYQSGGSGAVLGSVEDGWDEWMMGF